MMEKIFYIIISSTILICTALIGFFKNPIYSVLCLLTIILAVSTALISLHVYYLSLTLIIIYAGAVIILFLFLIITVNKDLRLSFDYKLNLPNNLILSFFLLFNLLFLNIINSSTLNFKKPVITDDPVELFIFEFKYNSNDIIIFSDNLFSKYFIFLLVIVFIMLFILISAIIIAKKSDYSFPKNEIEDDTVSKKNKMYINKVFYENKK